MAVASPYLKVFPFQGRTIQTIPVASSCNSGKLRQTLRSYITLHQVVQVRALRRSYFHLLTTSLQFCSREEIYSSLQGANVDRVTEAVQAIGAAQPTAAPPSSRFLDLRRPQHLLRLLPLVL
jgi:hypothetical protein